MKWTGRKIWASAAGPAALFSAGLLIGGAGPEKNLEQDIAASQKEYVVPHKVMQIADMNNYAFCEIGLITGTSPSNAVLNVWNTTSVGDCPPEKFHPILADKGAGELI
jgi:hypothetical protein